MGALLGLVATVAAIVLGLRAWQRRAVERAQPGRRREQPISITDYGEIDLAVRVQKCPCGGGYSVRGEGPSGDRLRVAHVACRHCGREASIYFDVHEVRH
ncbi:MAG: hypothetical protein SF182_13015 [Deltaproteobacteria bacterium]|nr:hypothetical protein [Deltaproteobacteria bacterium]